MGSIRIKPAAARLTDDNMPNAASRYSVLIAGLSSLLSCHLKQGSLSMLQAWVVHPAVLAGAGTVAMFVGIACVALAFSLPAHHSATALSAAEAHSPNPGLPDYALPPSVLAAIDGEEGTLYECKQSAELAAPQQYEAAAHAAELGTFGALASSLGGPRAVQAALDGLPNLRVPLVFWVLHSSTYVYSQRFPAAIATQVRHSVRPSLPASCARASTAKFHTNEGN